MKVKFIGTHRFYGFKAYDNQPKEERLKAIIPNGTICEARYTLDGKHLKIRYEDPTDGKRKSLIVCLLCNCDKIELLED